MRRQTSRGSNVQQWLEATIDHPLSVEGHLAHRLHARVVHELLVTGIAGPPIGVPTDGHMMLGGNWTDCAPANPPRLSIRCASHGPTPGLRQALCAVLRTVAQCCAIQQCWNLLCLLQSLASAFHTAWTAAVASKFTSALAQGGLSGKSKVRAGAPNRDVGASGILKPQIGQVVVEDRKLQLLQNADPAAARERGPASPRHPRVPARAPAGQPRIELAALIAPRITGWGRGPGRL